MILQVVVVALSLVGQDPLVPELIGTLHYRWELNLHIDEDWD